MSSTNTAAFRLTQKELDQINAVTTEACVPQEYCEVNAEVLISLMAFFRYAQERPDRRFSDILPVGDKKGCELLPQNLEKIGSNWINNEEKHCKNTI